MDAITDGLRQLGHRVRVVAICTHKHPCSETMLDNEYAQAVRFVGVHVDTRLNPVDAFSSMVTGESYNISRFHAPEMERILREVLRENVYDVVLVESLFMAPYLDSIRALSDAVVVLRAHNVEHRIWSDLAGQTPGLTRRTYLRLLAAQLERFEIAHLNAFDAILAITEEDAEAFRGFGCTAPIHVAPFGLGHMAFSAPSSPASGAHCAFHLGAMDWEPNLRGVRWLLDEVWPQVMTALPDAELLLAGRGFPSDFDVPSGAGITILGEIDEAGTLFHRDAVMVIPLLSGSGMRIKAVEGAAAGRPIVSTTIGIEGLTPPPPFAVTDVPEIFAQHIVQAMTDQVWAQKLAEDSKVWAELHYGNLSIVSGFADFCMKLLGH
jgi:glycosyltransferase involved in cell wall biosynthesis